jgi:hypothetical protein
LRFSGLLRMTQAIPPSRSIFTVSYVLTTSPPQSIIREPASSISSAAGPDPNPSPQFSLKGGCHVEY